MMLYGTTVNVPLLLLGTLTSSCGSGDDDTVAAIIAIMNNAVQTVISDTEYVTEYELSRMLGLDKIETFAAEYGV